MIIPIMTLGESLENMSLNRKNREQEDPVARAIRNGKAPTLKEVKMSVKVLRCLEPIAQIVSDSLS